MDGRIFYLKEELVRNLEYQWTIREMAQITELSLPHFQRLFKNEVGVSPIVFLQNLRLQKACTLLETTYLQMKQIGIAIGMLDESHFTRDFKKKYGTTPTQYRKQHWEKIQAEKLMSEIIESAK